MSQQTEIELRKGRVYLVGKFRNETTTISFDIDITSLVKDLLHKENWRLDPQPTESEKGE